MTQQVDTAYEKRRSRNADDYCTELMKDLREAYGEDAERIFAQLTTGTFNATGYTWKNENVTTSGTVAA